MTSRKLIAAHGNCFVLYRVFSDPEMSGVATVTQDEFSALANKAVLISNRELRRVATYIRDKFPNTYPQTTFKNVIRCREMDSNIPRGPDPTDELPLPGELFRR